MIIKASARAYGRELAHHLLNVEDNEHVEVIDVRGFVSDDLIGAFEESEAFAKGTRASKYLFSLSLNPPEDANVTLAEFESAADRIEKRLGLIDQPRALVLHDKNGRLHAHVVWSRIDTNTMTAKPLPFFKERLMEIAHDLYLEHGWEMPLGLEDRGRSRDENYDLAEAQQCKRAKRNPEETKALFIKAWEQSDSLASFRAALLEEGFGLARGDRRAFVAVDREAEVYSLSRYCKIKKKELKAKLGDPEHLPDIDTVRSELQEHAASAGLQVEQSTRNAFKAKIRPMLRARKEMIQQHRRARRKLVEEQKQRAISEAKERENRFGTGFKAVWEFVTGKRVKLKRENEADFETCKARDQQEREVLGARQRKERRMLEFQIDARVKRFQIEKEQKCKPNQTQGRTELILP